MLFGDLLPEILNLEHLWKKKIKSDKTTELGKQFCRRLINQLKFKFDDELNSKTNKIKKLN